MSHTFPPATLEHVNETTTTTKKLRRSRSDRMVAGVCGGVANLLGVDAALMPHVALSLHLVRQMVHMWPN